MVPGLTISISGGTATTRPATSAMLSGSLHESVAAGTGAETATWNGQQLAKGAVRVRGFQNGDLVTVVGTKASTDEIIPDEIFGGDRVELVEYKRSSAQTMFIVGISMMICAPIVLALGVLGALFGRQRK